LLDGLHCLQAVLGATLAITQSTVGAALVFHDIKPPQQQGNVLKMWQLQQSFNTTLATCPMGPKLASASTSREHITSAYMY
jgi:hypothetical protein